MKNINKSILAISAAAMTLVGCEDIKFGNAFLEKPVSSTITADTVFNSKYYAEQVLADCYCSLPDYQITNSRLQWSILEVITDLADKGNGISVFQSNSINSSVGQSANFPFQLKGSGTVHNPIYGIRKACIFMENVDRVPDMTDAEKKRRKGEALMVKAFHYAEMFRYMGPMPIMRKSFTPSDEAYMERPTCEEFVNEIVQMCDDAATYLDGYWSVEADDNGRFTQAAAKALKFRILLHAASPFYNDSEPFMAGSAADAKVVWYGNYDAARWERALAAGLDFLNSNAQYGNHYKMVGDNAGLSAQNPADFAQLRENYVQGYQERYNGELIIEGHRYTMYSTSDKWTAQYRYSAFMPTTNLHDVYEMVDGTAFDWNNPDHKANPFFEEMTQTQVNMANAATAYDPVEKRDPRLYETLIVNGSDMQGKRIEIVSNGNAIAEKDTKFGITNAQKSGMAMRKYIRDYRVEIKGKYYACPLMRVPEIYLGIAECLNALNKTADFEGMSTAWDYVNRVRSRAGMPGITPAMVPQGDDFVNYILDERVREFAFEEVRYHDIRRYKRADLMTADSREALGMRVNRQNDGTYSYDPDMVLPNGRAWLTGWSDKFYLVPIDDDQMSMDYGLIQNPGWEVE